MAGDIISGHESGVYGRRWPTLYEGYFGDPEIARPFLDAISHEIRDLKPGVVADLGGGTGFILSELARRHPEAGIAFIDIDASPEQLLECKYPGICSLQASAMDVTRGEMAKSDSSLMLIMRSLLHYLGRGGERPFLERLRAQMKPGEAMIHQTACFESAEDADCANLLYALMGTNKWYPTVAELTETLAATGWRVTDCQPAAGLCLKSPELAERYSLSPADIGRIRTEIIGKYHRPEVFVPEGAAFTAFLHYRIFTCRAS